jgi:hypothetical protein
MRWILFAKVNPYLCHLTRNHERLQLCPEVLSQRGKIDPGSGHCLDDGNMIVTNQTAVAMHQHIAQLGLPRLQRPDLFPDLSQFVSRVPITDPVSLHANCPSGGNKS